MPARGTQFQRRACARAAERARECADAIRADCIIGELWDQLDPGLTDPECSVDNLAGLVAGVLHVLPLDVAKVRFNRARNFGRAIAQFRQAVETYERQSGQRLPPPDRNGDRGLNTYLGELSEFLSDPESGQWVHPMAVTPAGQWPRTAESAVEVWVIRSLDNAGIPRTTDAQRALFLSLAVRLAELIAAHCPPDVEIATTRKKIQNHSEFNGQGSMQWRY